MVSRTASDAEPGVPFRAGDERERDRDFRQHTKDVLAHAVAGLRTGEPLHADDKAELIRATLEAAGPVPARQREAWKKTIARAIDLVVSGERGQADQLVREQSVALASALPVTFTVPEPGVELDPHKLADMIPR